MNMQKKIINCVLLDVVPKEFSKIQIADTLTELKNLTETVGGLVVKKIIQRRGTPSPKTYLGSGKAEEAVELVKDLDIDVVICNTILKPNQIMHLNKIFGKDIWDRVDLILNIFDKHAKSDEAYLQIKLARLKHEFPKLYFRQATTLFERSGAGIGTRGIGEKGIEEEKRHLRRRIKDLEKKIKGFEVIRDNQRKHRKRSNQVTVAIIGYTNAGKSELLRALTNKKNIYIADELFATLDTRIGKAWIPELNKTILFADTIGFLKDLPPFLIASFEATLMEAKEADILLHVIDATDKRILPKIKAVEEVLANLDCLDIPTIYAFNKIDLLKGKTPKIPKRKAFKDPILISAVTKEGLSELKTRIAEKLSK
jgi:GTP-binding protein HflX